MILVWENIWKMEVEGDSVVEVIASGALVDFDVVAVDIIDEVP